MRRWTSILVVAVVLGVVTLSACLSSSAESAPGSFYLEATITVVDDRVGAAEPEVVTHVRWWSESVDRWRWEFDQSGGHGASADGSYSLSDGETVWFYDARTNTYQRAEPFDLPEGFVATPLPISVLFGPANVDSLDDLAGSLLLRDDQMDVVRGGSESILGVETALLDYRPTWRAASTTSTAPGASGTPTPSAEEASAGGVGRMWVDEDRMFILRHEIDGESNRQYVLVEVTRVDYDVAFGDVRFAFTPPLGAVEEASGAGGVTTERGTASGGAAGN